ncbi:aKG-HExxH-type peptide beta-hydroxylase [Cystobacter fuscus]|uniref:aKG-HExxH-type peptide beta-hydroxylase n=1 Tax=Cystobacter fuscus TaxID=43 RepID=UPI0037BFEDB9
MDPKVLLLRALSTPYEVIDSRVIDFASHSTSVQPIRPFLEQHRARLEAAGGAGLCELLGEWLKPERRLETVWDPVFGDLRRVHRDKVTEALERHAALLGLKLQAEGFVEGEWSLSLGGEHRLRWGTWLLPPADGLSVRARTNEVCLELRLGGTTRRVEGRRSEGKWVLDGAEALATIDDPRLSVAFLPASVLIGPEYDSIRSLVATEVPDAFRKAWSEALDLLAQHAPRFSAWVKRFIRHIIPLREDGTLRSNSYPDLPGQLQMSLSTNPAAIAEMLIHESCHQHFFLANRFGPVHDGTDDTLYWSPVQQRGRHLRYILFAYHAFANVVLYYRACRAAGIEPRDGFYEREEPQLLPQLEELEKPLRESPALTALGRNLFEPLRSRIH